MGLLFVCLFLILYSMLQEEERLGKTCRGGQKKACLCSGRTGCFSVTLAACEVWLGLSKEPGGAGQRGEEADGAYVKMGLELAQSKTKAFCLHKALSVLFPGMGRAAKEQGLKPCQRLVLLGSCAHFPLWRNGVLVAAGFETHVST